jgi:hypothetical protein
MLVMLLALMLVILLVILLLLILLSNCARGCIVETCHEAVFSRCGITQPVALCRSSQSGQTCRRSCEGEDVVVGFLCVAVAVVASCPGVDIVVPRTVEATSPVAVVEASRRFSMTVVFLLVCLSVCACVRVCS